MALTPEERTAIIEGLEAAMLKALIRLPDGVVEITASFQEVLTLLAEKKALAEPDGQELLH